ncbi:hypothetical protein N0V83_000789 [Neocucurbitaria cava]|uniref:Uncharacterized protein n=1 Tax=Neocucurbitaria cava TaxID=798079 RepID=A0A9W8YHZ0_9PLEO|nr:hypothetical protein N0V83_000789 [Neocucurbitaria cava]
MLDFDGGSLTKVATTTATVFDVNPPRASRVGLSSATISACLLIAQWIYLTFLLVTVIGRWLARRRQGQLSDAGKGELDDAVEEDWQRPWKTKEWMALFGLIAMAHDNDWPSTPFREKYNRSIRERWHTPNKHALRRLLHKGIIPLLIQDGGVRTEQLKSWAWSNAFPYIQLPLFRQAKNRAYFEFLVPYPHRGNKMKFLQNLVSNKQGYGITLRFSEPPPAGKIFYSEMNPPCRESSGQHASVGAESAFEALLPFKKDQVFQKAKGGSARQLDSFIKGSNLQRIPLLDSTESVLVRVESKHWSSVDIDEFVYAVAKETMPEISKLRWTAKAVWEAASRELKRCGLIVRDA